MNFFRRSLLVAACLSFAPLVAAQDAPPVVPSQDMINQAMAAMERNARASTNPAYLSLLDAFAPFKKVTGGVALASPYTMPLSASQKFLKQPPVEEGMTLTRRWIAGFAGPDPNFHLPPTDNPFGNFMGMFGVLTGVLPLQAGWAAETRIGLATGNHEVAFHDLEENLQLNEALSQDSLLMGLTVGGLDTRLPVVYATALNSFTPRECDRLMRLCERWESRNGAWEIGLERSLRQEQEQAASMVEDDGSAFDPLKAMEDFSKNLFSNTDSGADSNLDISTLDFSKQLDLLFKPRVRVSKNPSAEAIQKRELVAENVAANYARIHAMFADPFAPLPPPIPKPEWMQKLNAFSIADAADSGVGELQKWHLRLRLLSAHTAIRKFRWEHDRLPVTLAELEQPRLVLDPMTKKSFRYTTDGETYTLTSVAPAEPGSDPKIVAKGVSYDLFSDPVPTFTLESLMPANAISITSVETVPDAPAPPTKVETKPK